MAAARKAAAERSVATQNKTAAQNALLDLARERFKIGMEAETELREQQLIDKRFRAGQQWEQADRERRLADKRPCLTVNRLPQFIKQITGQQRASKPAIQINPVDDNSDPDTAEVYQGLIRHIEQHSHAQVAYDQATDDQVTIGRGYIRLLTEFCDEGSWDQEIRIRRVRNPHSVTYDPTTLEIDYSDAMWAFVTSDTAEAEIKRQYPEHYASYRFGDSDSWDALGDDRQLWRTDKGAIRICEYFYVEYEKVIWALLSDGRSATLEEAQAAVADREQEILEATEMAESEDDLDAVPAPITILKQRPGTRRIVKWAKLCGLCVLKEGTWAGRWIPIVPVIGDEIELDGKVDYRGIVRDTRDQQRIYNFQVSALVEAIALAPRAPWVIAAGQLEGVERYWKTANVKSWAYLPYKAIKVGDTQAPPPQRQNFEPAIQAIVAAIQQADNDMKATTGMYDASLGERGPEQSGKAILARQKQGEIGNVHFGDNLARALWALGRQLVDLIPKIYDVPRVMRIMGRDDQPKLVMVHARNGKAVPEKLPKGIERAFDLGVGKYDVVVSTGPSHSTRRQEAVEMMTNAIQANPDLMQIIGDLYFSMMDWPGARPISDRLKKALPPNLQPPGEDGKPTIEQLMAQVNEQEQLVSELTAALEDSHRKLETKEIETASKENLELMKHKLELVRLDVQMAMQAQQKQQEMEAAERSDVRKMHLAERADQRKATLAERSDVRKATLAERSDARKAKTAAESDERKIAHERERDERSANLQHAETVLHATLDAINKRYDTNLQQIDAMRQSGQEREARQQEYVERDKDRRHAVKLASVKAKSTADKKPAAKKKGGKK